MPRFSLLPALLTLFFTASLLGALVLQEPPTGGVRGRVTAAENGQPLKRASVVLTNLDEKAEPNSFRARSGADGLFSLAKIPAGTYEISAATRAHATNFDSETRQGGRQNVTIAEGIVAESNLELERSEPELEAAPQRRVFGIGDKVFVPLRGYVAQNKPNDAAKITIYRARFSEMMSDQKLADALRKAGDRYQPIQTLPAELVAKAQKVAALAIPLKGDGEGFFHERVALPVQKPGLYLVSATHKLEGAEIQGVCSWVLVTDTALVVKKGRGEFWAYTADFKSGVARGKTRVAVFRGGQKLDEKTADAQGLAKFAIARGEGESRLTWVARRGDDPFNEAVLGGNDYSSENSEKYAVVAYTERPIYRPGDQIFYKGIARRKGDNGALPGPRYSVPKSLAVKVELRSPSDDIISTQNTLTNNFGSFHGSAQLSKEAPAGNYVLVSTLDGEEFTQDVVVSAYRKPEFTVAVSPAQKRYVHGDEVEMKIDAQYYFGSPVAGAKVRWEVYNEVDWADQYPSEYAADFEGEEFEGNSENYGYYGESFNEGEAVLDEKGQAVIRFKADPAKEESARDKKAAQTGPPVAPPPAQVWTLHATVVDAAEREVEGDGAAKVSAGDFRLAVEPDGYLAKPGQPKTVVLSATDFENKPLVGQPITLESGFSVWDAEADTSTYQNVGNFSATTGKDGKATLQLSVPRGGEMRLLATSKDSRGHIVGDASNLWAASDNGEENGSVYDDLAILTDQNRYSAGQTARVLVNAKEVGQSALLTLEGEKVYRAWTVALTQKSTVVSVPILAEYGPNVALAACAVRDGNFLQTETPLRVEVAARQIQVEVKPDAPKHLPGEPISYSISTRDSAGKPLACEVSVGVVDEAIYALREDNPRLLREAFYPRRYNSVETSYSFAVEYLGDANKSGPKIEARKKFVDTAFWTPAIQTDARGQAKISFKLPDNLTTWRATVMAQSLDSAFGRATAPEIVSKPFFVRMDKPRFAVEGDQTRILATIHNETGAAQSATVKFDAPNLTTSLGATQKISLGIGESGTLEWPVTTGASDAKITVSAWTDDKKWTDGVEEVLSVRPFGREDVQTLAGETGRGPLRFQIDAAALAGRTKVKLRLTPSVLDALSGSLDYLVGFPYGCVEQTTSKMLPDLLVGRVLRISGTNPTLAKQLPAMVRDGVVRLGTMQNSDGSWGWFEFDAGNAFLTGYALHGLVLAREEGYAVSENVLSRGREAALKIAAEAPKDKWAFKSWTQNRPFLLWVAARAGASDKALEIAKTLSPGGLEPQSLAYLSLLDPVSPATNLLREKASRGGALTFWSASGPEWNWDSDEVTATATAMRALLNTNPQDPDIAKALRFLMARRTGDYWESTRDTAWVLEAFADYLKIFPEASGRSGVVSVALNGQKLRDYDLAARGSGRGGQFLLDLPAANLKNGANDLEIAGANGVFYSLEVRQTLGSATLPPISTQNLKISREFLKVLPPEKGKWKIPTAPSDGILESGQTMRVRLTLDVPQDLAYVLIEDTFPAGCEPNERGSADVESGDEWNNWWSATDVRDDRIAFFTRTLPKGKHTIEYNLRAQTPGIYRVLPAFVAPMYAPEVRGETGEGKVEIR